MIKLWSKRFTVEPARWIETVKDAKQQRSRSNIDQDEWREPVGTRKQTTAPTMLVNYHQRIIVSMTILAISSFSFLVAETGLLQADGSADKNEDEPLEVVVLPIMADSDDDFVKSVSKRKRRKQKKRSNDIVKVAFAVYFM